VKTIIAGSRNFNDVNFLEKCMEEVRAEFPITEIISGGASGADALGEQWAFAQVDPIPIRVFRAEWDKYGKAAGPIRNGEMATYGDLLVLFWDGKSRGSKNMLESMKTLGKPTKVFYFTAATVKRHSQPEGILKRSVESDLTNT
jgi:hypothetical protein